MILIELKDTLLYWWFSGRIVASDGTYPGSILG